MKTPDFYFVDSHPLGKEWLIGTKELAKYFKVSTRTIHNWKAQGKIPVMRLSARCLRYSVSDVREALGLAPPNE